MKTKTKTTARLPKLSEIHELHRHHYRKSDRLAEFRELIGAPSIAASRRTWNAAGGDDWEFTPAGDGEFTAHYNTQPPRAGLAIDVDMPAPVTERKTVKLVTEFMETSKKWGQYCPWQRLKITRRRTTRGVVWFDVDTHSIVHGSFRENCRDYSGYRTELVTEAGGITVRRELIEAGGETFTLGFIAESDGTVYHARSHSVRLVKRGLKYKIAQRKANRKAADAEREANRGKVTIAALRRKFGWCPRGIEDFTRQCLPALAGQTAIEATALRIALKAADAAGQLVYARKTYRSEFAELLGYVRRQS